MKIEIIIILIFFVVSSCNSKKIANKNNCMSHATIVFYTTFKDDFIPLFHKWKNNLTDSVKIQFCNDVEEIIEKVDRNTAEIFIHTGGIHPSEYRLINPCSKGGDVLDLFSNSNFREKLKLKLSVLNEKYEGKGVNEALNLVTNVVNQGFIDNSCYFNNDHLNSTPYAALILELLIYQHTIYLFLQNNL